jgi:intracellular sulfur oxidation DsrE/DsrF family protein
MRDARIGIAAALLAIFALTTAHAIEMGQPTQMKRPVPQVRHVNKPVPQPMPHRVVIQVDQNDPAVMNLALNNATNVIDYYRKKGESADVEIVAFGPGLNMLRADTTPVADRIHAMKDIAFPGKLRFAACGVTREGMEKKEGKQLELLPEASMVPSGVVHMMELQEKGWSYVRP